MMIDNSGHRQRLRMRFLKAGRNGLCEHELLELLLCYSIPRKDVKPLAKELLHRFGSLEAVLSAGSGQLAQCSGVGENTIVLLKLLQDICVEIMSKPLRSGINLDDPDKLMKYLQMNCRHQDRELFQLLLLDRDSCLLDTLIIPGSGESLTVSCADLIFKILACRGTRQVIIAHNHLSSNIKTPSVSAADICSTVNLKNLLQRIGISLLDHFIIGENYCVSMMKMGLLSGENGEE